MHYKILFMAPYKDVDIMNDNIDVKVALSNDIVYSATLFTLLNIKSLLDKSDLSYFRAEDMIIAKDLTYLTINESIKHMVDEDLIDWYMSKIGTVREIFTKAKSYEDLINFASPIEGLYY